MQSKKKSYTAWKVQCQAHANSLDVVAGDDLWDDKDSYSLKEAAEEAWASGEKPEAFVERMFAQDLNNMANDRRLAEKSLESDVN